MDDNRKNTDVMLGLYLFIFLAIRFQRDNRVAKRTVEGSLGWARS